MWHESFSAVPETYVKERARLIAQTVFSGQSLTIRLNEVPTVISLRPLERNAFLRNVALRSDCYRWESGDLLSVLALIQEHHECGWEVDISHVATTLLSFSARFWSGKGFRVVSLIQSGTSVTG